MNNYKHVILVGIDGAGNFNHMELHYMQTKNIPAIITHALGIPDHPAWQSRLPEGLFSE